MFRRQAGALVLRNLLPEVKAMVDDPDVNPKNGHFSPSPAAFLDKALPNGDGHLPGPDVAGSRSVALRVD